MLILILHAFWTPAQAEPFPFRCHFELKGARRNQFITTLDQYGNVKTTGTVGSESFDCSYQILDFSYSPDAVIPKTEFYLHRKKCASTTKNPDRTRDAITVKISKTNKGFNCSENLVVNYPDAEDTHPDFDGKQIKLLFEKFNRGVWP